MHRQRLPVSMVETLQRRNLLMKTFTLKPIGYVRSEHMHADKTPIQPAFCPESPGRVEVLPEFTEGLTDIEGFSHIILLTWLHKAALPKMMVKPYLDDKLHGIFATRFPARPNPIGFSLVKLLSRKKNILHVCGIDILDNTPVLDIKPYYSRFDSGAEARDGWLAGIDAKTAAIRGNRGYKELNRKKKKCT
jgi:tRNA (adenine37-N6)-methyltransferase